MLLFGLNASYAHYAQGLYCIRSEFRNNGYNNCEVLEFNINDRTDEVLHKLFMSAKKVKAVGFSCYIWNINLMLMFAEELKKLLPNVKIIFGGPEVSFEDNSFLLKHSFVDYLVKGEGEQTVLELYKRILNEDDVENIIDSENFDLFIDRNINPKEFYGDMTKLHTIYYESSRGCPYSCSYCISGIGTQNKTCIRAKSVEAVIDDISHIYDEYKWSKAKINVVKFCDRTFNFNIKRANEIYKKIIQLTDISNPLTYQFEICPTLFDDESFEILSSAPKGLFQLEIGLQSINEKTLKSIDRTINCEKSLENIKKLKSLGNMHIHLDLIAGLPYEGLDSFKNGLNRIYELGDFIQIGFLKMLKGTKIRKEAEKYGYKYKSSTPYTVLENDFITYDELFLINDIEKVYKKYSSLAFSSSLDYVYNTAYKDNISALLSEIAIHFRNECLFERNISQKDAFYAFYEVFKQNENLDSDLLKEKLSNDFKMYENKTIRFNNTKNI